MCIWSAGITEEIRDVNKFVINYDYQSDAPLFWACRAPVMTFGDNFMLTCLLMSWCICYPEKNPEVVRSEGCPRFISFKMER